MTSRIQRGLVAAVAAAGVLAGTGATALAEPSAPAAQAAPNAAAEDLQAPLAGDTDALGDEGVSDEPETAPKDAPAETQRSGEAQASEAKVHGRSNGPAGPTTGTREQKVQRVLDAARSQVGKGYSYSWGAGGKGGASYGIKEASPGGYHDYDRHGYDCSGFSLYAYWKGAGIDIGPVTGSQIQHGTRVKVSQLQPGDLVFWGKDSTHTTHVAVYVGHGKVLQAAPPRGANSIRETPVDQVSKGGPVGAVRIL